jgi:hypothetical protein
MRTLQNRFFQTALLGAALTFSTTLAPAAPFADDRNDHNNARTYHDKEHNDDHQWNNNEDKAYRSWAKENHRKYQSFSKLKENDQQAYWGWRHQHSDAQLNINIR